VGLFSITSFARAPISRWVHLVTVAAVLCSCSAATNGITTQCVSNADQATTFTGHWAARPIPLAVVANDFTASELTELEGAIQAWNDFFQASKGFQLYLNNSSLLAAVGAGGTRITSATACQHSVIGPSGFTGQIMIYKTTAGWTYGTSVMALTSLCPVVTSGAAYRTFVSAVMEINYTNFFVGGQPVPDLQSVVTHELGHMLGLGHSCDGAACSSAPDDYVNAVMYPSLGFSGATGEVKRTLQTNDEERANCLY
jgi:hypothetical protein